MMKRRKIKKSISAAAPSPDVLYAKAKAALWLGRLLRGSAPVDDGDFFVCFEWATGGTKRLMNRFGKFLNGLDSHADLRTEDSLADVKDAFARAKKSIGSWRRNRGMDDFLCEYPALVDDAKAMMMDECSAVAKRASRTSSETFKAARRTLCSTFGIGSVAADLCEMLAVNELYTEFDRYFDNTVNIFSFQNRAMLAEVLDMEAKDLASAVKELSKLGIIDGGGRHDISIDDDVLRIWMEPTDEESSPQFCRKLVGECLPMESFNIDKDDLAQVKSFMGSSSEMPMHILLYGDPGTGKTTFARSLAKDMKVKAWGVPTDGDASQLHRRASLSACLNMASRHPGSFIVMDEAERFLDTGSKFSENSTDKAWLNDFLERPNVRMIWIVNDIDDIDASVLRRFAYSVKFGELNDDASRRTWRNILRRHRSLGLITHTRLDSMLKEHTEVPTAVIEGAVARTASLGLGKERFADTVERSLKSYTTLVNNGNEKKKEAKAKKEGEYATDGVSFTGSFDDLMAKCRRIDELMKDGTTIPAGGATMLFWGPPGTGKTALAKHIADTLGRKLVVKRASDLLSPYVGSSEQNVAEAFKEAEDAVLLIDEADSFLYSRESALRSWESTLVNEFLTALEECKGFCICTTNREPHLDDAAMRRFSFKFGFKYSGPEQVKALYKKVLAPLVKGHKMTPEQQGRLTSMAYLTPGDFRTVKTRHWLDEPDLLTHDEMINALAAEQSMKHDAASKKIGF